MWGTKAVNKGRGHQWLTGAFATRRGNSLRTPPTPPQIRLANPSCGSGTRWHSYIVVGVLESVRMRLSAVRFGAWPMGVLPKTFQLWASRAAIKKRLTKEIIHLLSRGYLL